MATFLSRPFRAPLLQSFQERSRSCRTLAVVATVGLSGLLPAAVQARSALEESQQQSLAAAHALIARVTPEVAGKFDCELIPADDGRDVFEYEAAPANDHVVLRGNSGGSLAVAFNQYLRREAHLDFDWLAERGLPLSHVTAPAAKVRGACAANERFFLNYCTYGYTFPWWTWAQWERFVDWMAMNGINRPLLQAGQEAIWLNVWRSYGLTDDEVRSYFSAPAHLPWHRMANLDVWGGPLPEGYIEGQRELQKQILSRARELGMRPILSAFAGHVPKALLRVRPEANISPIKPGWSGMSPEFATAFLDPHDPLFPEIQGRFLAEQERLYGTDHLYAADPFNEINPPSWEPDYLAGVSGSIYRGMEKQDPSAVWYQMTWTFAFFKLDHQWTKERLEKMFGAVPRGRMVLLDYAGEEKEFYPDTENCYGLPFIWNYLGNFGGNSHLEAPLSKVATLSTRALKVPNCIGIGSTLEGLGTNPSVYELLLEQPWLPVHDANTWALEYAKRRSAGGDPAVAKAWDLLANKVLVDNFRRTGTYGSVFQGLPTLDKWKGRKQNSRPNYEPKDLVAALGLLLQAGEASASVDAYQFDVVNFTRQALCDLARERAQKLAEAFEKKDLAAFESEARGFVELGQDLDRLLGTRKEFLLGKWLADARAWGRNPSEVSYYEHNARQILTSWHEAGGELTDYASRQWNGLLRDYYLPRWKHYLELASSSLREGKPFPAEDFVQWVNVACRNWNASAENTYATSPSGDPVTTAKELFAKYLK